MRVTAIAVFASLLLLPAVSASACPAARLTMAQAGVATELSADAAEKKKPKKMKKEKVEYMKSAAPPEPKQK
jgi:hypothetical protein